MSAHNPPRLSLLSHLLRPAVRLLVAPALDTARPVAQRRKQLDRASLTLRYPLPRGSQIQPDAFGGVPGLWVTNTRQRARRTVLYLHGGGYQVGSMAVYRGFAAQLAARWQADIALVDYRMAPEHVFPAATDDVIAAYRAVLARAQTPLIIAGDSAGGALTFACALQVRDAKLPAPKALVTFSPWTDLTISGDSANTRAGDDMLGSAHLRNAAQAYLGDADPRTALASPLFADLAGLPPTLIQATDNEILFDDGRRMAEALRAAGVDTTFDVGPGLWHVWQLFVGKLPEAATALARARAFIERHAP
ncbi:alpha/beta hydrolase [Sinimarinibacterium sp. NLF-5-8]|uniref:alpha/beta hydrolase n=1 Tax=Sinimarinibacterium sp. NLF-5-8 TaxID=2698684 RepID=UPI00137BC502|nr:alpha/beta hydrolase [Sinimarinibacterium sp. NLF-5-8]QHS10644.1 alpha/beta hydrolase [Sinimarinibacterium sp. NLF-5-8]